MKPPVTGAAVGVVQITRYGLLVALCLGLIAPTGAWAAQADPRVKLEEPERRKRRFVATYVCMPSSFLNDLFV